MSARYEPQDWDMSLVDGMKIEPAAEPLADGIHGAVLTSIEPRRGRFGRPYLAWHFLVRYEGRDRRQVGQSSAGTGPGFKFVKWATAILGRQPMVGETLIDLTREMRGRDCAIRTEISPKGYSNVVDVLPRASLGS